MAKRKQKPAPKSEGESPPGPNASPDASEAARLARDAEMALAMVAYYLDARKGPRVDPAPSEADYLEALFRDLIRETFEPGSKLRIERPDGVAVGLRDPTMSMRSFAYDLVRAVKDPSIDPPFRARAATALAVAMVLRSSITDGESRWRDERARELQVPEPWLVDRYVRAFGKAPQPTRPERVLPDLRVELELLAVDATLPAGIREIAHESVQPIATSEYLDFVRRCRVALTQPAGAPTGATTAPPTGAAPSPPVRPSLTAGQLLNPRQRKVYEALRENLKRRKARPSLRQLSLDAGVRAADVGSILQQLIDMGYVAEGDGKSMIVRE